MKKLSSLILLFFVLFSGIAQNARTDNRTMPDFLSRLNEAKVENLNITEIQEFYLAGSSVRGILHLDANWETADNLRSKTVYVEIINTKNNSIEVSETIRIDSSFADFTIGIPLHLETGNYQIRAFTNWMRNFSPQHFFVKNINIFSRTYKNEMPTVLTKPKVGSIQVYAEGGHILTGQHSKIFVQTLDNYGDPISSRFSLLNARKDIISSGQTDQNGRAAFDLFLMKNESYSIAGGGQVQSLDYLIKGGAKLSLDPRVSESETSIFLLNKERSGSDMYLALMQDGYVVYWQRVSSDKANLVINIPKFENDGRVDCLLLSRTGQILSSTSYYNEKGIGLEEQNRQDFELQFLASIYDDLENQEPFQYNTEYGISISGKILRANGKPIKRKAHLGLSISSVDDSYPVQMYPSETEAFFTFENLDFVGDSWATFINPDYTIELDTDKKTPLIKSKGYDVDWSLISEPNANEEQIINSLEEEVLNQIRKDNVLIALSEVTVEAKVVRETDFYGTEPSIIVKDTYYSFYNNAERMVDDLFRLYCPSVPGKSKRLYVNNMFMDIYNPPPAPFPSLIVNNIGKVYIMKNGAAAFYNCLCAILISTDAIDSRGTSKDNKRFFVRGYQN